MMKIEGAPTDLVERWHDEIAAILVLLGHPEAWVSDESTLGHFVDSTLNQEIAEEFVQALFGPETRLTDRVCDIARRRAMAKLTN